MCSSNNDVYFCTSVKRDIQGVKVLNSLILLQIEKNKSMNTHVTLKSNYSKPKIEMFYSHHYHDCVYCACECDVGILFYQHPSQKHLFLVKSQTGKRLFTTLNAKSFFK